MVYNYKRKSLNKTTLVENENAAMEDITRGMSIRKAAAKHGLKASTLRNRVSGKHGNLIGHPTVLTKYEEEQIVFALELAAENGWPCNRKDLQAMVKEYCTISNKIVPWGTSGPGRCFLIAFEKRWKHRLSKRSPQLLSCARATSLTKQVIDAFLEKVKRIYDKYSLHDSPDKLFDLDELGLSTNENTQHCFVKRGTKTASILNATGGKTMYSVLACGNAAGDFLPPFVIYKGENLYSSWCEGGPPGAQYTCTHSGWMEMGAFESWLQKIFVPYKLKKFGEDKVVLFMDGHGSHITYQVAKTCLDSGIIPICLPPNCTHAFQPLDVGVFSSLKESWRGVLRRWNRETRLCKVDKSVFPTLLRCLWSTMKFENICSGFRRAGLYPLNNKEVEKSVLGVGVDACGDHSGLSTPHLLLRTAILNVLAPPISSTFENALNPARKRSRVSKSGEILTEDNVMERLKEASEKRSCKRRRVETANEKPSTETKLCSQTSRKHPQKVAEAEPAYWEQTNISTKGRRTLCKTLGLDFQRPCSFGTMSQNSAPSRLYKVVDDGNCFFRSVTYVLTGSQDGHLHLRNLVVEHMKSSLKQRMEAYLCDTIDNYLRKNRDMSSGVWATDAEILGTASLLAVDINVFARYGTSCKLLTYPASLDLNRLSKECVFLDNSSGSHFDVVIS